MKALPILAACALLGATGAASANTVTLTIPEVGVVQSGILSFAFGEQLNKVPDFVFTLPIASLSPVFSQDVTSGRQFPEVDVTEASSSEIISFAFEHVLFTSIVSNPNTEDETVTFAYTQFSEKFTSPPPATPLPGALPLFATGLGLIAIAGWRRKRKAQAVA
jgi:type VI protein secretion system component Hcp